MASEEALAIERDGLCTRIEARVHELTGLELSPLARTHRDRAILHRDHLSTIADWLDRIPDTIPGQVVEVELNDSEAGKLLQARDLIESGQWTKAQMEAILLGSDNGVNE